MPSGANLDLSFIEGDPAMVKWNEDLDAALEQSEESKRPLLLDFSAAPM
jgi:hypothetical protein